MAAASGQQLELQTAPAFGQVDLWRQDVGRDGSASRGEHSGERRRTALIGRLRKERDFCELYWLSERTRRGQESIRLRRARTPRCQQRRDDNKCARERLRGLRRSHHDARNGRNLLGLLVHEREDICVAQDIRYQQYDEHKYG